MIIFVVDIIMCVIVLFMKVFSLVLGYYKTVMFKVRFDEFINFSLKKDGR